MLVVPDKSLTFDAHRNLTPLEHLILDFENPVLDRDILHYVDFFSNAFQTDNIYQAVLNCYENPNSDIHFHVWDENSFHEMITYFTTNIKPLSNIWKHSAINHSDANEFYFVITK